MLRLVSLSDGGEPFRTPLPASVVAALDPVRRRLLDLLVRGRLVTSADGGFDLAHEALVRAWPRLRVWLDEDRVGQQIRRHLAMAAAGWEALDHPEGELYRGARLAATLEWLERGHQPLPDTALISLKRRVRSRTRRDDAWPTTHDASGGRTAGWGCWLPSLPRCWWSPPPREWWPATGARTPRRVLTLPPRPRQPRVTRRSLRDPWLCGRPICLPRLSWPSMPGRKTRTCRPSRLWWQPDVGLRIPRPQPGCRVVRRRRRPAG